MRFKNFSQKKTFKLLLNYFQCMKIKSKPKNASIYIQNVSNKHTSFDRLYKVKFKYETLILFRIP